MIKPTELRIGNLLTCENQQRPILSIDGEKEFTDSRTNKIYKCSITIGEYTDEGLMWTTNSRWLKYFEPIKLEKEWLRAFGAEINSSNNYILDRFEFIWKEGYNYWYVLGEESSTYLTKIEYVHELQNFYFVMNGEDLVLLKEIGKE